MQKNIRTPRLFGLHAEPTTLLTIFLGALPFVLAIVLYLFASNARQAENEFDKLLPPPSKMWATAQELVFDQKSGETARTNGENYYVAGISKSRLYVDTFASLRRIAIGTLAGAYLGLLIGLNMGLFRGMEALARPMVTFLSIVNPLAILPILLIVFGVGEESKYVLIGIGIFFPVAMVMYNEAKKISREQVTKAFTLGASQLDVVYRIVLPQLWPPFIKTVAIALGSAWIFLVSAEAISASEGLGYRIYLAKRTMSMDVIIPYVFWMTMIGFGCSWFLLRFVSWRYPWYAKTSA